MDSLRKAVCQKSQQTEKDYISMDPKDKESFMTMDQLFAFMQKQKCSRCEQRAKWLPEVNGVAYCDEHYPYHEENLEKKQ